jgi:hypothetical protein
VGRVQPVDRGLLDRLRHEVLTVPQNWQVEYGQYQSGGWSTLSLMNASGNPQDVMIRDCEPIETTLISQMPALRELLRGLGLRYMWVRLARLGPNSFLWEHRDYVDLEGTERQRIHLPLLTNSSAFLVIGGTTVHLDAGWFYRLTPTYAHGVCNQLGPDRIHVIMDCYADDNLTQFLDGQQPPPSAERPERGDDTSLQTEFATALGLARLGYLAAAEQHLLRLFYQRALPEGGVYDLLIELHEELGDKPEADEWRRRKSLLLGLVAGTQETGASV